jgi:hypothetical protein
MVHSLLIDAAPVATGCIDGDMDVAVSALVTLASRRIVYAAAGAADAAEEVRRAAGL